jgi:hypothetical protein
MSRAPALGMTILDPVSVSNLAVYLVQLPRSRIAARGHAVAPPVQFVCLEQARAAGEVVISETGVVELVHLVNYSSKDLFLQAGEVLRGGDNDRAVAGDLIIPALRSEPESHPVPVFCVEQQRLDQRRGSTPGLFTHFNQMVPGRKLKKELRFSTQDDVWREIASMREAVTAIVSYGGTRYTPPYSLWMLVEVLEAHSWLTPYVHPLLPLAGAHQEATGAVFLIGGKFNNAELYATPAIFRCLWPKLVWAMSVEALIEQESAGQPWSGTLPTKGEVTAWLAAVHARRATRHMDVVTKRTHRRIRSIGSQMCFETLDQGQDGLCVHEFILANE